MERLGDPARLVVFLARERTPIHHGARIELRVVVIGERHRRERLLVDAVLMHEAARAQRNPLRGNVEAVGRGVRWRARDRVGHRGLAEAAELALREGAKDHAVFRVAGRDRRRRIADRARTAAATTAPDHPSEAKMLEPERGREMRRVVAIVGIAGDAVDIANVDAGVFGGLDDGFASQAKFRDRRLPALVVLGLADPDDRDLVLNCIFAHRHLTVAVLNAFACLSRSINRERPAQVRASLGLTNLFAVRIIRPLLSRQDRRH